MGTSVAASDDKLNTAQQPSDLIVLDACILMSGVLRPLLLDLAQAGLFKPVWSAYIGLEWRRNAARLWPINRALLSQEWAQMQQRFPDACFDPPLVVDRAQSHGASSDGQQRVTADSSHQLAPQKTDTLRFSDAKDHHVILAGVRALNELSPATTGQNTARVLTWNIRDFNRQELRRLGLGLLDPDRLLCDWWKTHPTLIKKHLEHAVQTLIEQGRREPAPIDDFLHRERLFRFKQLYLQAI